KDDVTEIRGAGQESSGEIQIGAVVGRGRRGGRRGDVDELVGGSFVGAGAQVLDPFRLARDEPRFVVATIQGFALGAGARLSEAVGKHGSGKIGRPRGDARAVGAACAILNGLRRDDIFTGPAVGSAGGKVLQKRS